MILKKLLVPHRHRKIPTQFSWVDQRLIRQGRLRDCEPLAWALYLFLCAISDEQGLSFYSDASLCRDLRTDVLALSNTRDRRVEKFECRYKYTELLRLKACVTIRLSLVLFIDQK